MSESQDTQTPNGTQGPNETQVPNETQSPDETKNPDKKSIADKMREVFKDVSFEEYMKDLASIERTPSAYVFTSHPDFMPKVVDKIKEGYDTVKRIEFEFLDMESMSDNLTINIHFYKSGPDGNLVEEEDDLIFDMASKITEIISAVLWGSIYKKYKNHVHKTEVEKTILELGFGVRLKKDTVISIRNGDNFIDIMKDEVKYRAFENILDTFWVRQWFMDSFASLNLATLKNYKGRYLFDQGSDNIWRDRGMPTEIFNSDIIIDEWIDYGANVDEKAVFIGHLSSLTKISISNSSIMYRQPIMINSKAEVRDRNIDEIEPDGDFKPGIQYQMIFKLQISLVDAEKPWLILSLSDSPETK